MQKIVYCNKCSRLQQTATECSLYTRMHAHTHLHTLAHTHSLSHTHVYTHTYTHKLAQICAHSLSLSLTYIHTHTHLILLHNFACLHIFCATLTQSKHLATPCSTLQHPITHLILLHSLCVLCFRATLIQAGQFALM